MTATRVHRARRRAATLLAAAACVAAAGGAVRAQPIRDAPEEAKHLVAMISCRAADDSSVGAGIIVGVGNDTLYVATADHVVRGCRGSPDGVRVLLRSRPDTPVAATVASESDSTLDLAVLRVAGAGRLGAGPGALPFDRLGDPDALRRGDGVFSLGRHNRLWALNVTRDPIADREGDRLYYESNVIGPGHSGGALLDEEFLVIGMIRSDQPPHGEAVSITRILARLRQWRYPVGLVRPSVPAVLASIAVGASHLCGLDGAGAAYCWGQNNFGQLGTGTTGGRVRRVLGGLTFRSLSASNMGTCGVTTAGTVYCWGVRFSELSGGADSRKLVPTSAAGDLRFRTISGSDGHACGVTEGGAAYCWGKNELGQLGDGSARNSTTPVRVVGNLAFKAISIGGDHTCALTADGAAYCWGHNINGELGNGSTKTALSPVAVAGDLRFASISASPTGHTCGVTTDGHAYCWGLGRGGALGNGPGDVRPDSPTPTAVAGGFTFTSVTTGAAYTCGVATTGAAYCWGSNEHGQLGNGATDASGIPVPVTGGFRFTALSTASFRTALTCGLTIHGVLYCWGRTEERSQMGAAFQVDVAVPAPTVVRP